MHGYLDCEQWTRRRWRAQRDAEAAQEAGVAHRLVEAGAHERVHHRRQRRQLRVERR